MRRIAAVIFLGVSAATQMACGDPIVVLGESPNTVRNVVGIGDSAGNRIDTLAYRSRFLNLSAVVFDDATNLLYVADRGAARIVDGLTTPISRIFSVTSSGRLALLMDGGGCQSGGPCLIEPTSMIAGAGSTLLIADATASRVFQFDFSSRTLTSITGNGAFVNAVNGAAATTGLNRPAGLVRDVDGTLFISERGSGRILKVGASGTYQVIAGGGTALPGPAAVSATAVRLASPSGIALANGVLYIADRESSAVYALNVGAGTITRIAGDGTAGFSGDNGLAVNARLQAPSDVELNTAGSILYVADTGNNRIRAINLATGIITTYMGSGSALYNGDHVAAGAVSLKTPIGLDYSSLGFLFVVDQGHSVVRRASVGF